MPFLTSSFSLMRFIIAGPAGENKAVQIRRGGAAKWEDAAEDYWFLKQAQQCKP